MDTPIKNNTSIKLETVAEIDRKYLEGSITYNDAVVRTGGFGASFQVIENIDENGKVEVEVPLDTPKWLKGRAEHERKTSQRQQTQLAKMRKTLEERRKGK